jgi:3D (Asp-Asp-Asp) domain-containing protein/peptidoglycan hydrolase-like protein with peptidoglycan-binding domain
MFHSITPPRSLSGLAKLQLWATRYYVYSAIAIPGNRDGVDLIGNRNASLGVRLTKKDYCLGSIEGTIAVRRLDGSTATFNYLDANANPQLCDCTVFGSKIKPKTGKSRYRPARGPFGDGVQNYILVPFRTIAVDPNVIPFGTALFIPDAVGARFPLPDGTEAVHDGYFFAADTGGAIKGTQIDVFQGILTGRPFAPFITSDPKRGFTAHVVTDAAVTKSLRDTHLMNAGAPLAQPVIDMGHEEMEASVPIVSGLQWLKSGSSGPLVRIWQRFLIGQGLDPKGIDGVFGNDTKAATAAFQTRHRLDVDGEVGNQTWGKALMLGLPAVEDLRPASDRSGDNWPPLPTNLRRISHEERVQRFGSFRFRHRPQPDNYENIEITDAWESTNIIQIDVPAVARLRGASRTGRVRLHRDLRDDFLALWNAWDQAGLLDRLVTWEGMFVPRFMRKTSAEDMRAANPRRLSNHSWGTAFDVNYQWNRLDTVPALLGQPGCVRELVALANQHGFYWGGHFSSPRDGMHFEAGVKI